jgi:hypothetical protein
MLVYQGGTPAGTFHTAVLNWRLGDKFEGGGEMFRILDIDAANPPEGTYGGSPSRPLTRAEKHKKSAFHGSSYSRERSSEGPGRDGNRTVSCLARPPEVLCNHRWQSPLLLSWRTPGLRRAWGGRTRAHAPQPDGLLAVSGRLSSRSFSARSCFEGRGPSALSADDREAQIRRDPSRWSHATGDLVSDSGERVDACLGGSGRGRNDSVLATVALGCVRDG